MDFGAGDADARFSNAAVSAVFMPLTDENKQENPH